VNLSDIELVPVIGGRHGDVCGFCGRRRIPVAKIQPITYVCRTCADQINATIDAENAGLMATTEGHQLPPETEHFDRGEFGGANK